MSETVNKTLPPVLYETLPEGMTREDALKRLLWVDYESAVQDGLIDMFYYDPDTGEDALLHTLTGDVKYAPDNEPYSRGFHHEPSAALLGRTIVSEHGVHPATFVDRSHVGLGKSGRKNRYREYPLEPYAGQVVVGGLKKRALGKDEDGSPAWLPARNSMYPKEYDAYMILKMIRQAYDSRDQGAEKVTVNNHGEKIIDTTGVTLLMDGESQLPIRMILDADSGKIKTAHPIIATKPGTMRLTQEQADLLIYGNLLK